MTRMAWLVAVMVSLSPLSALAEATATFSPTGPDADAYGAADGYPVGAKENLRSQRTLVGAYSHFDQIRPARTIPAPAMPSKLERASEELALRYTFQGKTQSIDSYLERNPATGLLILRDHTIAYEHYRYARTDQDRFTSQSMAKTIVAMTMGIAVADGAVRSIDDIVARYVPELANTEAGNTPLRALLSMSSGLQFHEVYDGKDDIMRLGRSLMKPDSAGAAQAIAQFDVRSSAPGTVFNYAGLDTEMLALAITRATGKPLTEFVASRLWGPIGAEASASWTTDAKGAEVAYCCFNAVLRDWGRFGALLAADGAWDGKQIIPRQWLLDATTVHAPYLAPGVGGRHLGYGYQVWLLPGTRRQFALRGIYGQTILVDPATHTVLVHTAVRPKATNNIGEAELMSLWDALVAQNGS